MHLHACRRVENSCPPIYNFFVNTALRFQLQCSSEQVLDDNLTMFASEEKVFKKEMSLLAVSCKFTENLKKEKNGKLIIIELVTKFMFSLYERSIFGGDIISCMKNSNIIQYDTTVTSPWPRQSRSSTIIGCGNLLKFFN